MTTPELDPPVIDLAEPNGARYLLLHDDYFVREKFVAPLEPQIEEMADALAVCFKRLPPIMNAASELGAERTDLMKAFLIGVLDDLVVSVKLLLAGKLAASGNVARQMIEGLAMAILCSTDALLVIEQKENRPPVQARYWQKVMKNDSRVQGQHAVRQLRWNAELLGLSEGWIASLVAGQKRFSGVSHAGKLTIMTRTPLEGADPIAFGGHFDRGKEPFYRIELVHRIELCRQLAIVMDQLLRTMARRDGACESFTLDASTNFSATND